MIIHTVSLGDTVFKIARKYNIQPTKIIEDNGLINDRLVIGQELLILTPTRTVTVRGGDTLASIARRFGIRRGALLANNPALCGCETLRPGHILSVKYDTPRGGASTAVGYFRKGCTESRLKAALPYLTYAVFSAAKIQWDKCTLSFNPQSAADTARRQGRLTLLGFQDTTSGEFLKASMRGAILEDMITLAKAGKYGGIELYCDGIDKKEELAYFLMEARKRLIGCDLVLFTRIKSDTPYGVAELSDGAVLCMSEESVRLFSKEERDGMQRYAEGCEAGKTFIQLETEAYADGRRLNVNDCLHLALRSGAELRELEGGGYGFPYRRYIRGRGEDICVRMPSLTSTLERLKAVSDLGFMGVSFDIESVPTWLLCLYNTYFSRADYSLVGNE